TAVGSAALRQTQKVVRLLPVCFRFDVLVAVRADGDNDVCRAPTSADVEAPLTAFDTVHRLLLGDLPRAAAVRSASAPPDVSDPLVGVIAVVLVDAGDLVSHLLTGLVRMFVANYGLALTTLCH